MINKALKLIRQFHELKQTDLASQLNISKSYLSELESGKKPVTLDILKRYSQAFDIPVSSLVFFSESIEKQGKVSERFRASIASKILKIMEWVIEKDETKKIKA